MTDMVNHPPHYKSHPSGVECRRLTVEHNFNVGNAIKYGYRWQSKGDPLENLRKMEVYLGYEEERLAQYIQDTEKFFQHPTGDKLVDWALIHLLSAPQAVAIARTYVKRKISILEGDVVQPPDTEGSPD